jgi:Sulfotransferase domain
MDLDRVSGLDIMESYVVGQANLGYAVFDPGPEPQDVILVSFPKSGSTWTSYLLHQLRSRGDDDFRDIKDEVIDITPGHWDPGQNPFLVEQRYAPRTFKTHGRYDLCPKGGKFIYLARNPEDSLVSLYHFIHDLFGLEQPVSLEQFYRRYFVDRFDSGHDIGNVWEHLLSWYPHRSDPNTLWIHYEDLIEDRTACLHAIRSFMSLDLNLEEMKLVEEHSHMDHTRRLAQKLNPSQSNRVGKVTLSFGALTQGYARNMKFGKMRRGVSGDGRRSLPKEILEQLKTEWQERIQPQLGYTDYHEMRKHCSLLKRCEACE